MPVVAGALGLTAAAALAEAHRREDALLRLRGATDRQLVRLAADQGLLAGMAGIVLGLLAAAVVFQRSSGTRCGATFLPGRLAQTVLLSVVMGAVIIGCPARADAAIRSTICDSWRPAAISRTGAHRSGFAVARGRRILMLVGAAILGGNLLIGGLKPTPVEGQTVALSFYVLLAPLALWIGATLLIVRGLLGLSGSPQPARSSCTADRPGERPSCAGSDGGRANVQLPSCSARSRSPLGTEVATFVATYGHARGPTRAPRSVPTFGLTPTGARAHLPTLGPGIVATAPIRTIPGRAGSDRKNIMAIEADSYARLPSLRRSPAAEALLR